MDTYQGDNIGSLAKAEIIEHHNVLSLAPLRLAANSVWIDLPFKEETGKLNLKSAMTANGRVYTYSGRFFFNRMREEVDQAIGPYLDDVAILRLTDMNGRIYILGAPGAAVTIGENGDTGQRYINENGIEYTFAIDQPFPATTG